MITSVAKTLLKNHIRHADTHNRMVEETEMWAARGKISSMEKRSSTTKYRDDRDMRNSFLFDQRDDPDSPRRDGMGAYMDRQPHHQTVSSRTLDKSKAMQRRRAVLDKTDPNRWGHDSFEKMYPTPPDRRPNNSNRWGHDLYDDDSDSDRSEKHHRRKRRRTRDSKGSKKKRKKDKKSKKRIRKYSSESDEGKRKKSSKERNDTQEFGEKETADKPVSCIQMSSKKDNSDLLLMQQFAMAATNSSDFTKPSKPRMKMRTWASDSSADSSSDSESEDEKLSQKRKRKKRYSTDSNSDSKSDHSISTKHRKKDRHKKRKKRIGSYCDSEFDSKRNTSSHRPDVSSAVNERCSSPQFDSEKDKGLYSCSTDSEDLDGSGKKRNQYCENISSKHSKKKKKHKKHKSH